jgi:AraC-like DNA-binding protein
MARRLLIESEMSVERIARLLDYSSTPPFTLAFKRWFNNCMGFPQPVTILSRLNPQ